MLEARVVLKRLRQACAPVASILLPEVQVLEAHVVLKRLRQGFRASGSDINVTEVQVLEARVVRKRLRQASAPVA